jgi:hypothetical protein
LPDRPERCCGTVAHHPLGPQLRRHGGHDPAADHPVARRDRHHQADRRADHEVAKLHRHPQRPVEDIGQAVDATEDPGLHRGDPWSSGPDHRRAQDPQAGDGDDDPRGYVVHGLPLAVGSSLPTTLRPPAVPDLTHTG